MHIRYGAANRDERMFSCPHEVDLERPNADRHLAFGHGIHYCMGARIAELQLRILWEEILPRFERIEVQAEPERTLSLDLAAGGGRWELRRGGYRHLGRPRKLIVLSDVSRALRAEELGAWKRLIRVMSHELNNSLAPIRSLAGSLDRLQDESRIAAEPRSAGVVGGDRAMGREDSPGAFALA